MTSDIGENMRKVRVHKNFSQEYVSEQAGINITTYSRYERGEIQPKFETVVALCKLYKMTLDEFYHYDDEDFDSVSEPLPSYLKSVKVMVTVELDGLDNSLQSIIKKLTAMNTALNQTSF
jgi:transcriptional regulator with XRE-family HTH domain